MSHVFISYARSDEALASQIADRLREGGFEVWRDDELPAHRPYAEVIEERLSAAKAVVVLWSAEAAQVAVGAGRGRLADGEDGWCQASIDGAEPPMPFNQIQCADLKAGLASRTLPAGASSSPA